MLEWRPRLIFLMLVIVLVAYASGFAMDDLQLDNWEW